MPPVRSTARISLTPAQDERSRTGARVERWGILLLTVGAAFALLPLWAPLMMAGWAAVLAAPLQQRWIKRVGGGRHRAAAAVTVLLSVVVLAPMAFAGVVLWYASLELMRLLQGSSGGSEALRLLVSTEPSLAGKPLGWRQLAELADKHGAGLANAASTVIDAATTVVVGLFVFVAGFYTFLVQGRRGFTWALAHSPIPKGHLARFAEAYVETGRGLFIGMGLTALLQGALATAGYVALQVPQALVLGLLTTLASLIPLVGSGLIWLPVAIGLFLSGRPGAAVAILILGLIVSTVDNFARPALARRAHLQLNSFLVFVAMLGGTAAFGAFGLLLGPLLVRLAIEGFRVLSAASVPANAG